MGRIPNQILLSKLIAVWDILHVKDTGALGFCDLQNALEASDVKIENDINPYQPYVRTVEVENESNTIGKIAIYVFSFIIACGLYLVLDHISMIWR